jgi:hypothetical protein
MAVKTTGKLTLDVDVKGEHGGARPLKMSDYYRKKRVEDLAANQGVPTTETIHMSDFYGTTSYEKSSKSVAKLETIHFASYTGSWSDKESERTTFTSNYTKTRILIPKISMSIRGDEDEGGPYSGDDHNGVRNPGVVIKHVNDDGTETTVLTTRGTGSNEDDDSGYTAVDIPTKSAETTLTGTFKVYFILGGYNGGASWNAWKSPAWTIEWETA